MEEAQSVLRGTKENRLRHYLGPLLKLSAGFDPSERWPDSPSAIEWLNKARNRIAHAAERVDYSSAARGIYASPKVVVTLSQEWCRVGRDSSRALSACEADRCLDGRSSDLGADRSTPADSDGDYASIPFLAMRFIASTKVSISSSGV